MGKSHKLNMGFIQFVSDSLAFTYKGENLCHDHVLHQYQKKIICDQIRKSATPPVLQGRFQCHKKQLARINVIDLQ